MFYRSPAKVADPPITVTKSTPISSSPHDITSNGLEKSKSDSKLNQVCIFFLFGFFQLLMFSSFIQTLLDDEPIKRSNSNHSMGKKSPKKAKKSKSTSKLDVVDKDVVISIPNNLAAALSSSILILLHFRYVPTPGNL
jgi:hypothetical protein